MSALSKIASGWRAVCLIAITYVYFLLFAQFAFLNRLGQLGIEDAHLQTVMATMAVAGIASSLLAAFRASGVSPRIRLTVAFLLCGAAAASSTLHLNLAGSIILAFIIGAGLGLLTVTLVSHLNLWLGRTGGVGAVGAGTGIGYFLCNVPALFTAQPNRQAIAAGLLCLLAVAITSRAADTEAAHRVFQPPGSAMPFVFALIGFTALVWLDSAAFFIIQSTPSLKAGTWEGSAHLWGNAVLHLGAALLSSYLLLRRGTAFVLCSAVLALAVACLLLHDPARAVLASLFYPVGVSLYSVALVAYPSLLSDSTSSADTARRAGLIYAVAGWIGSALGIGMGQNLKGVPVLFVVAAVLLIFGTELFRTWRTHRREITVVTIVMAVAFALHSVMRSDTSPVSRSASAVERGRQVYIAEGCINCHSQYVRPGTADVALWGPAMSLAELRAQKPPLIGNRRQGPDLSQVGGRRSPLWLKAHLFSPGQVSHASFMPSYRYLFHGSTRGDDLVQYLSSLESPSYQDHIAAEQHWQLPATAIAAADADEGALLYGVHCATCHEPDGATRLRWSAAFKRLPPDLRKGPWRHVQVAGSADVRTQQLATIVRYGMSQTDMPGHEYLSDQDISSIVLWLNQAMEQSHTVIRGTNREGEKL